MRSLPLCGKMIFYSAHAGWRLPQSMLIGVCFRSWAYIGLQKAFYRGRKRTWTLFSSIVFVGLLLELFSVGYLNLFSMHLKYETLESSSRRIVPAWSQMLCVQSQFGYNHLDPTSCVIPWLPSITVDSFRSRLSLSNRARKPGWFRKWTLSLRFNEFHQQERLTHCSRKEPISHLHLLKHQSNLVRLFRIELISITRGNGVLGLC